MDAPYFADLFAKERMREDRKGDARTALDGEEAAKEEPSNQTGEESEAMKDFKRRVTKVQERTTRREQHMAWHM